MAQLQGGGGGGGGKNHLLPSVTLLLLLPLPFAQELPGLRLFLRLEPLAWVIAVAGGPVEGLVLTRQVILGILLLRYRVRLLLCRLMILSRKILPISHNLRLFLRHLRTIRASKGRLKPAILLTMVLTETR